MTLFTSSSRCFTIGSLTLMAALLFAAFPASAQSLTGVPALDALGLERPQSWGQQADAPTNGFAVDCTPGQFIVNDFNTGAFIVITGVQEHGQTFTAPCDGVVTEVDYVHEDNGRGIVTPTTDLTLIVYDGFGTGGTVLGSQAFIVPAAALGTVEFPALILDTPIPVTMGSVYSFFLDLTAGQDLYHADANENYPDGDMLFTLDGDPATATVLNCCDMRFAVVFDPLTTVTTAVFNGPGWRLLSAPVPGMDVGDLAAMNLVQGIPGQYPPPQADPNIFTSYIGGGTYTAPAGEADAVDPGYGFYWYWYDEDNTPPSGGTSVGHELTGFMLSAVGVANTADVANTHPQNVPSKAYTTGHPFPNSSNASGTVSEFYLVGNPFADPLEADGITSANVTLSSVFNAWDQSVPGYVSITGAGTFIAPWQGLFAEVTSNSGVDPVIDYAFASVDAAETPPFYGRHASSDNQYVSLSLSGETDSGVAVGDRAAMVRFLDDAEVGFERQDGSKLYPLHATYALLSPVGERFGAPYQLAVNSLPTLQPDATEVIEAPVAFIATDASDLEITWEGADALPEEWTVALRDTETGVVVDLATETSYGFSAEATGWVDRFVLVFTPAGVVANEGGSGLPTTFALTGAYPNPFNPSTTVRFDAPEAGVVSLDVFDTLGRHVATLFSDRVEAGQHAVQWDAASVSSGVYVIRMSAGDFTQAQRVTLLK